MKTIKLTDDEIDRMIYVLGNSTSDPGTLIALCPSLKEVNACIKGENKLRTALSRETIKEWTKEDFEGANS